MVEAHLSFRRLQKIPAEKATVKKWRGKQLRSKGAHASSRYDLMDRFLDRADIIHETGTRHQSEAVASPDFNPYGLHTLVYAYLGYRNLLIFADEADVAAPLEMCALYVIKL